MFTPKRVSLGIASIYLLALAGGGAALASGQVDPFWSIWLKWFLSFNGLVASVLAIPAGFLLFGSTKKVIAPIALGIIGACAAFWFCFPQTAAKPIQFIYWNVVLDLFGGHALALLPVVLFVGLGIFLITRRWFKAGAAVVALTVLAVLGTVSWWRAVGTDDMQRLAITKQFPFEESDELFVSNPDNPRYTNFEVVLQNMVGFLGTDSDYSVEGAQLHAQDRHGKFCSVAPAAPNPPDAFWQRAMVPTPFAVEHNDDMTIKNKDDRIRVIQSPIVYGENRIGPTEVMSLVMRWDPLCAHAEITYTPIGTDDNSCFILVRKTGYTMSFKVFPPTRVEYWRGVSLISPDGVLENLTPDEAMNDPRLDGLVLHPEQLTKLYVDAASMQEGSLDASLKHKGRLEVPEMPGHNQQPFLLNGLHNDPYQTMCVEPKGSNFGLFGVYVVNGQTGRRIRHKGGMRLGPVKAINELMSQKEMFWSSDGKSSNGYHALEMWPWFLPNGRIAYQIAVNGPKHQDVIFTGIVDSQNNEDGVLILKNRKEFMDWAKKAYAEAQAEADAKARAAAAPK